MDFSVLHFILVIVVGAFAGFLNTMAGGGSLITIPVLIFLGLPSAVANGTNRIALMAQNITAIGNFKNKGIFDWKISVLFAFPAIVGSIIGSRIAINLPDAVFNKILVSIMLIVLFLILFQPQKKLRHWKETMEIDTSDHVNIIAGLIAFFFVGLYGGLIQAGVGFIIMTTMTLISNFSLVRINGVKVFVVFLYMLSSLAIFISSGNVNWLWGITLAIGNSIGAYIGSTLQVEKGDKLVKAIMTVVIIIMAIQLLQLS